jgi:phosphatidate phosphatase LPIN
MDIIIVRQPDDSYKITPFRIRFGSFRVFRAKEKTVNILINGQKIDLTMRLSECGEAYFINEIHKVVDDSNYLSDCYSPAETGNSAPSSPILKLNQKEKIDVEPLSLDNSEKPKEENVETEKNQTKTELDGTKSDQQSEINLQVNEINDTTCLNTSVQEKEDKLSYNNDFSIGREDFRIRKMSFDVLSRDENFYKFRMIRENSFCIESTKKFNNKIKIELSNSWNLISKSEENVENLFDCKKVTKDEYFRDPWKILNSKELAFKYDDHIYTWKVIAPMIFSQLAFGEDLPTNVLTSLTQNSEGFFIWKKVNLDAFKIDIKKRKENEKLKIEKSKLHLESSPVKEEIQNEKLETNHISLDEVSRKLETTNTANIYNTNNTNNINSLSSNPIEPNPTPDSKKKEIHRKLSIQYRKTYILTSDQIRSLNLSKGRNEISFVVSSRYQGTHVLSSEIYLFDSDDKIVISDLDGTITRSDVLGHVLPYFGKDWSHKGVVKLFNKISEHGYKIVYLTARSISQSDQTKNYLRNKLIQSNFILN